MGTMDEMETLYGYMLGTPKEEKQSIEDNLKVLKDRIDILQKQRNKKNDEYEKDVEKNNKYKETRDAQIKSLKAQVANELSEKDKLIENAQKEGDADEKALEENHNSRLAVLRKELEQYEKKYKDLK